MHCFACLHVAPNSSVFELVIQCHLKVNGDFNACTCLGILSFHSCVMGSLAWFFVCSIFFMHELAGSQGIVFVQVHIDF